MLRGELLVSGRVLSHRIHVIGIFAYIYQELNETWANILNIPCMDPMGIGL